MIKLICDLNIHLKGHNAGHVQYIVNHIQGAAGDSIYFLFNKSAKDIIDISKAAVDASNFYFADSDFEDNSVYDKLKFKEWKVIKYYAAKLNVDKLFIMELTRYEVQIGIRKPQFKISGIEFRPSHRITQSNNKLATKLKATSKKVKKIFLEKLLLLPKVIESIYILNDTKGVAKLNSFYRTNVFKYLADPIYDYALLDKQSLAKLPHINRDKVVFLIFGAISSRKNIENILNAFSLIDKSLHNKICLLIVGKTEKPFVERFKIIGNEFRTSNPCIEFINVDDFVTDSQMEYYFSMSHVSLVIYANFYGSSGLLGRAAKYDMISLVPNVGLMADLCTEYNLGRLCDPNSVHDIKDNLVRCYNDIANGEKIDGNKFYKAHSGQSFLKLLNF